MADVARMTGRLLIIAVLIVFGGYAELRLLLPRPAAIEVCIPAPVAVAPDAIGLAPAHPWRQSVLTFTRATGTRPQILEEYQPFGQAFDQPRACRETQMNAIPLVQILPGRYKLSAIAAGRYDRYLKTYADAVHDFRQPLILSFAPEMNAAWWPWGYGYDSPQVFKAAWRHVVDVFRAHGTPNVIWLWDVNKDGSSGDEQSIAPPAQWWPGSRYVDMAGIDGYFNTPADTFASVFAPTLASLSAITAKPVLIAETATATASGPAEAAQIQSLFSGARASGVAGFVWFDIDSRERWHIEDRPAADAAFRAAALTYTETPRGNRRGISNGP